MEIRIHNLLYMIAAFLLYGFYVMHVIEFKKQGRIVSICLTCSFICLVITACFFMYSLVYL